MSTMHTYASAGDMIGLKKKYPNVIFYGDVSIKENVAIGDGTRIGEYAVIGANAEIGCNCRILYHVTVCKNAVIGNNVFIGPNTSLLNDKYPPTHDPKGIVTICDNAVIGAGCLVLPNVTIGESAVIVAGSVVTKDVPHHMVVGGNPVKPIMTRYEYDQKKARLLE